MDWVRALKDSAAQSPVVLKDDLAERFKLSPLSVSRSLARLEKRDLVERVTTGIYVNRLASEFSPYDLVSLPEAENGMDYWGLAGVLRWRS